MRISGIKDKLKGYKDLPVQMRASFWFLICSFFQKGVSVITTPIFTRLMSTSEYGVYTTFNAWYGIAFIFITLNLSYGVFTQGLIKFDDKRKNFSASFQGITFIFFILWLAIFCIARGTLSKVTKLSFRELIVMVILIWLNGAFSLWASEQRVDYKYRELVVLTILNSVLSPTISIILVTKLPDKVFGRIIGMVIAALVIYTRPIFKQMFNGGRIFDSKIWKYAICFNLPLLPHYLSQTILDSSDRIMITNMVGKDAAGIYGLAYSISLIMTFFNTALLQTIHPWLYEKIKINKIDDIHRVVYPSMVLIAGVNLLLIMFAPEAVSIFAPQEYQDAIWAIPPVAMSVFFLFTYGLFADFEFYYEKTYLATVASIIGAILNVILNYLFIPVFGYVAASYTTLFCYIIFALLHYLFMQKICNSYAGGVKPYKTKYLVLIIAPFLLMGFGLMATYKFPVIRYAIIVLTFIIAIVNRKKIKKYIDKFLNLRK